MLVVEKCEAKNFMVVDARSFMVTRFVNTYCKLQYALLLEAIKRIDGRYCKVLSNDQLDENFLLSPSRYLLELPKLKDGETANKLQDVVTVASGNERVFRKDIDHASEMIVAVLSSNYTNCDVTNRITTDMNVRQRLPHFVYEVEAPCLMVQITSGSVKVGELHGSGKFVIGTLAKTFFLRANSDKILDKYLLRALTSEFVGIQVEAYCEGVGVKQMRKEDLMRITIPVPSLDSQKEAMLKDLNLSVAEGKKRLATELAEYMKDVHVKKHAIGQILFGLNANMSLLRTIRSATGGKFDENMVVGDGDNAMTVGYIFDSIDRQIKHVNSAVANFTAGEDTVYKVGDIALPPFFEEYCAAHQTQVYRMFYQPNADDYAANDLPMLIEDENGLPCGISKTEYLVRKGEPMKFAKFSKQALEEIMDNICANAMEYGFRGREDENNIIRVSLEQEDTNYVVYVSNNGHPANPNINVADVFQYGVTSSDSRDKHSGIGGYQIKKLMERFGGTAEFVSQPDSEFPVIYRLTFKDTNCIRHFDLQNPL